MQISGPLLSDVAITIKNIGHIHVFCKHFWVFMYQALYEVLGIIGEYYRRLILTHATEKFVSYSILTSFLKHILLSVESDSDSRSIGDSLSLRWGSGLCL